MALKESFSSDTNDSLEHIADRLYVLAQALIYGEGDIRDHLHNLGGEAHEIYLELDDLVAFEKMRKNAIEEEMEKFEKGFAYVHKAK